MTNPLTHCNWESGGVLGTAELPVPNFSDTTVSRSVPAGGLGSGNIRGIMVLLHGLQTTTPAVPFPIADISGTLPVKFATFAATLVADGWIVVQPPYQEDRYISTPIAGLYADVAADASFGARYVRSTLNCHDHLMQYLAIKYGAALPVCVFGFSEGAWKAMVIAMNRPSTIKAFGAHCPATLWENVANNFTPGFNFGALTWTGIDLGTSYLAGCTVPGIVGYHTGDTAVGYSASGSPVSNTQSIITNAPGTIVGISNPDGSAANHELSTGDANYYSGSTWVAGTGATAPDVLCPKAF